MPAGEVTADLATLLGVVVRGYVAVDAKRLDDIAGWLAARLAHGPAAIPELSARECDILRSMASGHTLRETAIALGVAAKTIENTQARLFLKLGAHSRAESLAIAHRLGLVDPLDA